MTHALHFLSQVDYIYTLVDGHVAEWGTYEELMSNKGTFSRFINEFVSKDEGKETKEVVPVEEDKDSDEQKNRHNAVRGAALMQAEERNTGAVGLGVYKTYSAAANGRINIPLLLLSVVLVQVATVLASYWSVLSPLYERAVRG